VGQHLVGGLGAVVDERDADGAGDIEGFAIIEEGKTLEQLAQVLRCAKGLGAPAA